MANFGFEIAGANPGEADDWAITSIITGERLALFGATPNLPAESFDEEWDSNEDYLFALVSGVDTLSALFDTDVGDGEGPEDFEEGWSANQSYLFAAASEDPADLSGPDGAEDLESGWSDNENYLTAFVDGTHLSAADIDTFDADWNNNTVEEDWGDVSEGQALFDPAAPQASEDFEETFTELQVIANAGTDTFTAGVSHGLLSGDSVTFRASREAGSALPSGLNPRFIYYVIAAGLTATAFRVSSTFGGSALDITDIGAGTFYVRGSTRSYWIIEVEP